MISAAVFTLFCIVCVVLAFARHPIWGVYFYLATTFVYPPGRWWGYIFGDIRWALLSAAVTALAIMFHRGKLAPKPLWLSNAPAVVACLYAAWMWIQMPWALDMSEHMEGSVRIVKYVVAFWFVYRVVDTPTHLRDFLFAHVLGCALLGLYAHSTGRVDGRLDGVGGPGIDDANTLGMYLVTGAIVSVALFITQTGWRRWVSLVAMAIIANGFVLANSRGAFLGLIAGGLVIMLCKARTHRRLFWGLAVVSLAGLVVVVDKTFVDRMFTIQDATSDSEEADRSARSRMVIVEAQARMFADHPMGVGHRGTATLSTSYMDREWLAAARDGDEEGRARSSHNTFMTTLVEQGIPGALLYIALTLWTAVTMVKVRALDKQGNDRRLTTLAAGVCGGLAVVWVAGHTADYLMAEVQFWLFAALVSALQLSAKAIVAGRSEPASSRLPARPLGASSRSTPV